jgi:DNA repair protein RadC
MQSSSIALRGRGVFRPWETDDNNECPLHVREGGHCREASAEEVIEYAQRLIAESFHRRAPLPAPSELKRLLQVLLAPHHRMTFAALFLDSRGRVIELAELFQGTIDRVCVHVREVLREVFLRNAASIILVRSDPSGCAQPTENDERQSAYLRRALAFAEVFLVDYLIVGATVTSLAEEGWPERSHGRLPRPAAALDVREGDEQEAP